ncbi:MAG: hypothetical protein ACOCQG_00910 [Candidatus Nanoarchaeia archaeon]
MPFSKSFPKATEKSVYPKWEEVFLTGEEELEQEKLAREQNYGLMKECIDDAREIFREKELKVFQSDIIRVAATLFEKRASHPVFYKESKAKEKFDAQHK